MNPDRQRESQGHLRAKKRLEKKQKSLHSLLSDDEKAVILKVLGRDKLDKKPKFSEKVMVQEKSNPSSDSPRKTIGRKNKKGKVSLLNLVSDKEIKSILTLYKKTNLCKENEDVN